MHTHGYSVLKHTQPHNESTLPLEATLIPYMGSFSTQNMAVKPKPKDISGVWSSLVTR